MPHATPAPLCSQEPRQSATAGIRKLTRVDKLAVPQHETVLEAETRNRKVFAIFRVRAGFGGLTGWGTRSPPLKARRWPPHQ